MYILVSCSRQRTQCSFLCIVFFFIHFLKVELGSRAGALRQMLLDLLEDPHEIRRICIMGRNCTLRRGDDNLECTLPSEKLIAEGKTANVSSVIITTNR